MIKLEVEKNLDFNSQAHKRNDLRLSTDVLFGGSRGQMFGILICRPADPSSKEVIILKAFSGQYNGVWEVEGWAPPLISAQKFENAVKQADPPIKKLTEKINSLSKDSNARASLIEQRRRLSRQHMQEIHSMYTIRNFKGCETDLFSLFEGRAGIPAGTGDCCAPKLLNQAAVLGLTPISMAEFYWGRENRSGTKQHRGFYPPCTDKCMPILGFMLQGTPVEGIEILYSDDAVVVINKPHAILSIPGRGPEKQDSAASRIRTLFPGCIKQPSVHRLDMDTSGLMVFALTSAAHRNLSIAFQNSEVKKKYVAVLDGRITNASSGRIELKYRLNPDNRPFQVYDPIEGKLGITLWKKIEETGARTRVEFEPITGRTHQLRLHSAHKYRSDGKGGLGAAIVGDRLYGNSCDEEHAHGVRMLLHASMLSFTHPMTGEKMSFKSKPPF